MARVGAYPGQLFSCEQNGDLKDTLFGRYSGDTVKRMDNREYYFALNF